MFSAVFHFHFKIRCWLSIFTRIIEASIIPQVSSSVTRIRRTFRNRIFTGTQDKRTSNRTTVYRRCKLNLIVNLYIQQPFYVTPQLYKLYSKSSNTPNFRRCHICQNANVYKDFTAFQICRILFCLYLNNPSADKTSAT